MGILDSLFKTDKAANPLDAQSGGGLLSGLGFQNPLADHRGLLLGLGAGLLSNNQSAAPLYALQGIQQDQTGQQSRQQQQRLQQYAQTITDPTQKAQFMASPEAYLKAQIDNQAKSANQQFVKTGSDPMRGDTYGVFDPSKGTVSPYKNPQAEQAPTSQNENLNGDAFLATLPKQDADQIKALAEGRMAFPSGFAMSKPYWQNMVRAVGQYDPNFDAVNFQSRAKTRNDFTAGKSAQNIASFNTAIGHLGTLDESIDGLNNSNAMGGSTIRKLTNPLTATLDPTGFGVAQQKFDLAKDAVSKELVRAFRGSGGSLTEVQGFEDLLKSTKSPAELHAAVKQGVELLNSRVQAVGEQYQKGMGTTSDPLKLLSPHAQDILKRLTGDVATQNPAQAGQASPQNGGFKILGVR